MTDADQQLKPSNEDRRNPIASVSIRNVGLSMTHGVRRLEVTGSATSVDWVETSFMRVQIHEGYSVFLCRQRTSATHSPNGWFERDAMPLPSSTIGWHSEARYNLRMLVRKNLQFWVLF